MVKLWTGLYLDARITIVSSYCVRSFSMSIDINLLPYSCGLLAWKQDSITVRTDVTSNTTKNLHWSRKYMQQYCSQSHISYLILTSLQMRVNLYHCLDSMADPDLQDFKSWRWAVLAGAIKNKEDLERPCWIPKTDVSSSANNPPLHHMLLSWATKHHLL